MFNIIGAIKAAPVKLIVISIIISSLIGFIIYYDKARYEAGWNAAKVELYEENEKAIESAVEATRERLNKVIATQEIKFKRAEIDSQALRNNRSQVGVKEVVNAIESSHCDRVGVDYIRLLNKYINPKSE